MTNPQAVFALLVFNDCWNSWFAPFQNQTARICTNPNSMSFFKTCLWQAKTECKLQRKGTSMLCLTLNPHCCIPPLEDPF